MDKNGNQIRGTSVNSLRDGLPNCDDDPGTFVIKRKRSFSGMHTHRNKKSMVKCDGITKYVCFIPAISQLVYKRGHHLDVLVLLSLFISILKERFINVLLSVS